MENILEGMKDYFESDAQSVLRGQENRYRKVVIDQGVLVKNERSEERGVCAKVYKNGVNGFASTAEYSRDAAALAIKSATENAEYLKRYAKNEKQALPGCPVQEINSRRFIIDFEQRKISCNQKS